MDRRLERMPAAVAVAAASFLLSGALLLVKAASDVMTYGGDRHIAYGLATLAGMGFTAIGLGIVARRSWARIFGILGGVLVMLSAVGIGWGGHRLFVGYRTWFASRPRTGEYVTSVPAIVAAGVMFLVGLLLAPWGPAMIQEGLGHGDDSGGVREALILVGGAILVIGLLHVLAALLVWAHRDRGRSWGIVIGGMGTLLGAAAFAGGANNLTLLLMPVPHLVVLIGLSTGRSHFTRRHAAPSDLVTGHHVTE